MDGDTAIPAAGAEDDGLRVRGPGQERGQAEDGFRAAAERDEIAFAIPMLARDDKVVRARLVVDPCEPHRVVNQAGGDASWGERLSRLGTQVRVVGPGTSIHGWV